MSREQILDAILSVHANHIDKNAIGNGNSWWMNRRSSGGLRLSLLASELLMSTSVPRWSFDLDPTWITPKNMLRMDRLIPVPYSLDIANRPRRCCVTVWDSGQAMTIELIGDFDRFLASLERAWTSNFIGKC